MRQAILALGLLSGCYVDFSDSGEAAGGWGAPRAIGPEAGGVEVSGAVLDGDVASVQDVGAVHATGFGDARFLSLMIDAEGRGGYAMVGVDVVPEDGSLDPGDWFAIGVDEGGDGFPNANGIACSGEDSGSWEYDAPIATGEIEIQAGTTASSRTLRFRGVLDTGQVVTGAAVVEIGATEATPPSGL